MNASMCASLSLDVTPDDEIADLRARLRDAEDTLAALRSGAADALLGETGVFYLKGAERPYVTFFSAMNEGGVTLDGAGVILYCNPRFAAMSGRSVAELRGRPLLNFVVVTDRPQVTKLLASKAAGACDVTLATAAGLLPVQLSLTPLDDGGARLGCLVVTDMTLPASLQHELERQVEARAGDLRRAAIVFENTLEGVMVTDMDGTIRSVNPAFSEITGYSAEEAVGATPALLRSQRHPTDFYRDIWTALHDSGHWRGEIWNRRKSGELYLQWTRVNVVPAQHGEPACYVTVFTDITDLWRKNERMAHLAYHDALTDLPNRTLLLDRLGHALTVATRQRTRVGVLFIDLDGFKAVNDHLGHLAGDLVLQEVAERLKARVRGSDTVARLGGDEFVVLMENLASPDECAVLAAELVTALTWDVQAEGFTLGASIGIAVYPDDGLTPASLLDQADKALYAVKAAGKGGFRFCPRSVGV
jgi:diguanylate cyclase (GGDEF)-like protein/PAS domain S-box-containing protein